jgi:hypothetical protein
VAAEKRLETARAKAREKARLKRREAFWGKEVLAFGRSVRAVWRFSRSSEYRKQARDNLAAAVARELGPVYKIWRWQKLYRAAEKVERRQMLGHALIGKRGVSAWRFLRDAEHRTKTKAKWRYRTVNKLYAPELRRLVKVSRATGRISLRISRAAIARTKSYKQSWWQSGYMRNGEYVPGGERRRRTYQ